MESVATKQLISRYRSQYGVNIAAILADVDLFAFYQCELCGLWFFHPPVPGTATFYAELGRVPGYYNAEKEEYRLAARRITGGQTVLEVGCGPGQFRRYLPELDYIGLELNPEAVKAGLAKRLDVRAESIETFAPRNRNRFDAVCAFQVLEHVTDPSSFIAACAACVRPSGLIMFGVPNADGFLGAQPDEILNMPPHHQTWWAASVFWTIAKQFGLEVVAIEVERLPSSARDIYEDVVALRGLMNRFNVNRQFFFEGRLYTLVKKIARLIRIFLPTGFGDPHFLPVGHTLLAVLRKLPTQ